MGNATYQRLNRDILKLIVAKGVNIEVIDATGAGMVQIRWQDGDGRGRLTLAMEDKSAHFWMKGFLAAIESAIDTV